MKITRLVAALAAAIVWITASIGIARADGVAGVIIVASCGSPPNTLQPWSATIPTLGIITVDTTGKVCVNATVSASITGFPTVQSTGTPIAVTTGGVTGTLPTGAVVVASNVGATNGAYCKLGASATTSDQLIPPNSWFAFTVGANTQLTCITSTSTTTVNMVGGSGLPTGSGGGGGGGSGGAVTLASAAVASGAYAAGSLAAGAGVDGAFLTPGAKADAPCALPATTTPCSQVAIEKAAANAANTTATNSALPLPAQTGFGVNIGAAQQIDAGSNAALVDPCQSGTKVYTPVNVVTATNVIIAGVASKKKYICQILLYPGGTVNFAVYQATTGTSCATAAADIFGGHTTGTGFIATAGAGFTSGNGASSIAATNTVDTDICVTTSTTVQVSGVVVTVDR